MGPFLKIVATMAFAWSLAIAQDGTARPAFDVASVKASAPNPAAIIGLFTYPGGRIQATNYTLRMLLHEAYSLEEYRILGGPRWVDEDRFDVEAKPSSSSESSKWEPANFKSPPNEEMRQMLQTLLAELFQLKIHSETRKEQVFALVVAKGGAKLTKPASTSAQPFVSFLPRGLEGKNATVDQLAGRVAAILKRPVLNQTGIQGNFDFLISYPPDETGLNQAALLLSALPEQVGLKLETEPGMVEVVVIDGAEKPSAN